jgi:hypothetical protein
MPRTDWFGECHFRSFLDCGHTSDAERGHRGGNSSREQVQQRCAAQGAPQLINDLVDAAKRHRPRLRPAATWHLSYSQTRKRPAVPGLRAPVVVEDLVYRNLIWRVH